MLGGRLMRPVFLSQFLAFLTILALYVGDEALARDKQVVSCLESLKPIAKARDRVNELDGMWGLLESSPDLQPFSSKGIQLDSRINKILTTLNYLCETGNGVPLNELATYLINDLMHKDKAAFHDELIILGKTETEIGIWFEFHDVSLKNQNRKIDFSDIDASIKKASHLVKKYEDLSGIIEHDEKNSILLKIDRLTEEIDRFMGQDKIIAQGISEEAQVPYWDINEDVGGS